MPVSVLQRCLAFGDGSFDAEALSVGPPSVSSRVSLLFAQAFGVDAPDWCDSAPPRPSFATTALSLLSADALLVNILSHPRRHYLVCAPGSPSP